MNLGLLWWHTSTLQTLLYKGLIFDYSIISPCDSLVFISLARKLACHFSSISIMIEIDEKIHTKYFEITFYGCSNLIFHLLGHLFARLKNFLHTIFDILQIFPRSWIAKITTFLMSAGHANLRNHLYLLRPLNVKMSKFHI